MPASYPSPVRRLGGALLVGGLVAVLAGCAAGTVSARQVPGAASAGIAGCSLRAVVDIRQGGLIRNDADLVETARRLGVNVTVLQSMGRNTRIIVIREPGPQSACEDALASLRNDLSIESVRH